MTCPICGGEAVMIEIPTEDLETGYKELICILDCLKCGKLDCEDVDLILSARADPLLPIDDEPDGGSPPES